MRKALRAEGWTKGRQTGSHETWESADGARVVTVAGKDSDRRRRASRSLLRGLGPVDIVVMSLAEADDWSSVPNTLAHDALAEGRVLVET